MEKNMAEEVKDYHAEYPHEDSLRQPNRHILYQLLTVRGNLQEIPDSCCKFWFHFFYLCFI